MCLVAGVSLSSCIYTCVPAWGRAEAQARGGGEGRGVGDGG